MLYNKKQLILFIVALSCGLVAAIGVSQQMKKKKVKVVPESTDEIYVAKKDVNINDELTEDNIMLAEWPKSRIPPGTTNDFRELKDRFARTRMYKGEPILKAKLMDSNGGKSTTIPAGYRVMSVGVTMDSSVTGLVQPGDRVDVLVFLRKTQEISTTRTKTILQDITVFAVDAETERCLDVKMEPRSLRTVSLLVRPEQAETIMLASQLGELSLTLRRPNDGLATAGDGQTVRALVGVEEDTTETDQQPQIADSPPDQDEERKPARRSPHANTGRILVLKG